MPATSGTAERGRDALLDVVALQASRPGGKNDVTRAALLDSAKTLTKFEAGRLFGTENIAQGKQSSCYVFIQIDHGPWKRVNPTKTGTFDCKPSN
jgi:hypothetical protein